jgi:tripartite-type tricarboxylate transporter receptor subunit TctC
MRYLLLALLSILVHPVVAQDWPRQKTIHIIVGFAPASTTDLVARLVAPKLGEALGQSVVVENKPGAGGNVAAQQTKRAPADGYTLFVTSVAYAVNPSLYADAGYDPFTDFVPLILGPSTPNIITVNPAIAAKNLKELVELARKEKLSYASSGTGTTTHLSVERIKMAAKIDITHVPYQPAQAAGAAVGGHTQISSTSMPPAVTHVRAGRLRAIAVTSAQRSPALPDVPTTAELGQPRLLSSTWFALLAPKGTPPAVIARMNAVANEILADAAVKKRLADMGASTLGGTPQQLAEHLAAETEKWGRVVREARIAAQ